MSRYPLTVQSFDKSAWTLKVKATLLLSFEAEPAALPQLREFVEILDRLNTLPLSETLVGQEVVLFFFEECVPVICQNLVNSKYFKCDIVYVETTRYYSYPIGSLSCRSVCSRSTWIPLLSFRISRRSWLNYSHSINSTSDAMTSYLTNPTYFALYSAMALLRKHPRQFISHEP